MIVESYWNYPFPFAVAWVYVESLQWFKGLIKPYPVRSASASPMSWQVANWQVSLIAPLSRAPKAEINMAKGSNG